jgi:hypothetical protein
MTDEAPTLTEDDIVSQLWAGEQEADTFRSSELADRQAVALDYYDAQPMGDETEGHSKYIEPVVAEVVDDMTIGILEAFLSGDNVVEFEAGDVEDDQSGEQFAADATAYINYLFYRKMDGERFLTDYLQSGLNEVLAVAKLAQEDDKTKVRETAVVPSEALGALTEEDAESVKASRDNGDGTHTLEFVTTKTKRCFRIFALPSEEFLFSSRMRSLDDKSYRAHASYKSISELIGMGFDREQCEDLPEDNNAADLRDIRAAARWRDEGLQTQNRASLKGNNRRVRLLEEYDYFDIDGDGVTELCRAFRVGKELLRRGGELAFEPWDDQPFVGFCPYPRAHKLVGDGLAEKVIPDQRIESVITRKTLDGLYSSINPTRWLPSESTTDDTIEDLLTVRPHGGIVRGKGLPPPNLADGFKLSEAHAMLSDFRNRRQARTGILNLSKGMDKDALNDTASGQEQLMTAGEKKQKYVARNFARSIADIFLKLMRMVRESGEPMKLKVDGKFKEIDPSQWPDEMDFSIKVGLGTNGKDRRIAARLQLGQIQAEALGSGLPIVTPQNAYNSAVGLVRDMGLGEPTDYFTRPEELPQGEKPDPEMAKVQAEQQRDQAKLEGEQTLAQARLQIMQAEGQAKQQLAREQAEHDAELAAAKAQHEAELAEARLVMEERLAEQRMAMETRMNAHKAHLAQQSNDAKLSQNRPGGSLDA